MSVPTIGNPSSNDVDRFVDVVKRLVQTFADNREQYMLPGYKEANLRKEFVDKFFMAMGWDVNNDAGLSEKYKEVINEDAIKIGGRTKAPDYAFRIGGTRVFFVEAKKPSVNIVQDPEPALQLRRYAWNSGIPLSILTSFTGFAVYDCTIKPSQRDGPAVGRLMLLDFQQYENKSDELVAIFSKNSVLKGSFDRYATKKGKKGTTLVDTEFLREMEQWRAALAKHLALRNPSLSIAELNMSVQQILDRVLFLRICEDKDIEEYGWLKSVSEKSSIYKRLNEHFLEADQKYNSGIFDFTTDTITSRLELDDGILTEIIQNLYYPRSPYDFSVLGVEILGKVYEQFLGRTIRLTPSHHAKVEEKPEVRQAGGVYYTPDYVADYIVKNTVGHVIEGKTPAELEGLRILDPAAGSGTFLVRAYAYLLDHHLSYYMKNPSRYPKEIYRVKEDQWYLTTEVRKKILLNNIFGLDIDPQAVEITKLSLLLKVLEFETKESVNQQLKLFRERALPNLDKNIKCGNALVDSTYFEQSSLDEKFDDGSQPIRPFEWRDRKSGFGTVIDRGGFDVIIGNPPYVKEDVNRGIFAPVKMTNMKRYYQKYMDYWYFFSCRAIDLLRKNGRHSFITQNNWVTSDGATILRDKILSETKLVSLVDFNEYRVFKDASIQTMIFVVEKNIPTGPYEVDYNKAVRKDIATDAVRSYLSGERKSDSFVHYPAIIDIQRQPGETITLVDSRTSSLLAKLQKASNYSLRENDIGNGIDVLQDFVSETHLEKLRGQGISKGAGIFVLTGHELRALGLTRVERSKIRPYYTPEELGRYYGNPENRYWLIYADEDVRTHIGDYPLIKRHLDQFSSVMTSDFRPYGLHRPREERFFEGEKILSLRKTPSGSFTYTGFSCYVARAFLILKPSDIDLKFLTGVLNSSLMNYWLYHKGKKQGEQLQVDKEPLLKLPIFNPIAKEDRAFRTKEEIAETVTHVIACHERLIRTNLAHEKSSLEMEIAAMERRIDSLVCDLYSLTDEDRKLIDSLREEGAKVLVPST